MNAMTTVTAAPLLINRPEAFIRAYAVCNAVGYTGISQAQLKWAESQTEEYGAADFWMPYGILRGACFMKPWAAGIASYFFPRFVDSGGLARIDPEAFYHDLPARIRLINPDDSLGPIATQAWELTTAEGARGQGYDEWAEELDIFYAQIRNAQHNGTLITDARRVKCLNRSTRFGDK